MQQQATLEAPVVERLISAASAAPSVHNTQPWSHRVVPGTTVIEVRADPARALRYTDPAGRALHISVGASLFNLRVAASHLGWEPVVRLLPHPADPGLLATVRLAGRRPGRSPMRPDLYEAIWQRRTSRLPFSGRRLPSAVPAELEEAAHQEGATLRVPDRQETARVLDLTAEAERRNGADANRRAESRRWIIGPEGGDFGLPAAALGPLDATGRLPMRDFSALSRLSHAPSMVFENHPAIAVLSTAHDRRADWLRTGQALQHVLLVATRARLRASLLHQAMEWPDLRWALRDARGGPGHVQMLVRIGYGPAGAATPRRSARDTLTV